MRAVSLSSLASFPLVLTVMLAGLGLLLLAEKHRPKPWSMAFPWVLLGGWLLAFVTMTLLFRKPYRLQRRVLEFFWSYRQAFSLENGLHVKRLGVAREIGLNVLLMVPLGYTLPGLLRKARHPLLLTAGCGFCLSLAVELLQFFLRIGYLEPDDLFDNTLGCLAGAAAWYLCLWIVRRTEAWQAKE